MASYRSQAHRPAPWWVGFIGLAGYVLAAAGVVFVAWFVLQAFLGMGTYIETVLP